ncbi:sulfurtransferase complex subunit TusB [Pseudomonas citronellolis]|uniref:sulfurtransferase complex subunit TusB n=1 Tax=Pseudomonas citronellolis TaxID=53408 RepID=UPI0023E3824D|nr:sulfurtransferase complex subunit TusB [Pseudomonas citronellolis]MDF3936316.1 sulfurtransferase complex subunit TusB [Pseudomonas citronellolis]
MSTLHLLSHSPFGDGRLDSCLLLLGADDGLLLSGDAVYALALGSAPRQRLESLPNACFALDEDLQARGLLASLPANLRAVDYPGFVELCTRYDKVNAWL